MRALLINEVCGIKSTGRICTDIAASLEKEGYEVKIAFGRDYCSRKYLGIAKRIGNCLTVRVNALLARILDNEGLNARLSTRKFIRWAEKYDPDLLWLHNLHGYYINYEILFSWIKSRPSMKVMWTLHDCWAFTGHCAYFSMKECYQWKSECARCPQKHSYPKSWFIDNSTRNYMSKKCAFSDVSKMEIVVPSVWLLKLVKESFLAKYPARVVYNQVDKSVFLPTVSDFRREYCLEDKIILLGVASDWSERKGLKTFIELSRIIDSRFRIVLVGVTKKQRLLLPEGIVTIPKTNSAKQLAEIYSAADFYINASVEETFGMTTVEALYCGTSAIVLKNTACEEIASMFDNAYVSERNAGDIYNVVLSLVSKEGNCTDD